MRRRAEPAATRPASRQHEARDFRVGANLHLNNAKVIRRIVPWADTAVFSAVKIKDQARSLQRAYTKLILAPRGAQSVVPPVARPIGQKRRMGNRQAFDNDLTASDTSKQRASLFHESAAAFNEILTRETVFHQTIAKIPIRLVTPKYLSDRALEGIHRLRSVFRDGRTVPSCVIFKFNGRNHAVYQAHCLSLGGGEVTRREKDLLREGWAHQIHQFLHARRAITQSEPSGGDTEL